MTIDFVYPSGRRFKVESGIAIVEQKMRQIVERVHAISCATPLGSDFTNRGTICRSLFTNDVWINADGIPKSLRNKDTIYLYFGDSSFGIQDLHTMNRKRNWRVIYLHRVVFDKDKSSHVGDEMGRVEHLWESPVDWENSEFLSLARPTSSIGPDFTGDSGRKLCRAFQLKLNRPGF